LQPCGGAAVPAFGHAAAGIAPCYVTAQSSGALRSTYRQFMAPTRSGGHKAASGGGGKPKASSASKGAAVIGAAGDGKTQAAALGAAGMPVYYPRAIAASSRYCTNATCSIGPIANSYPRAYQVRDQRKHLHTAYRMTLVINPLLGQYYGVQGTNWRNPPILNGSHQTRTVNGKRLQLFSNGGKLVLVAWRTGHGTYWISNTLTSDVSDSQMVAIAASLTRG